MNQLETLLNTLIARGWKPFGMEIHAEYIDRIVVEGSAMHIIFKGDGECIDGLRALVSLESGLWRFVCMHSLISEKADMRNYREDSFGFKSKPIDPDGEYRIIKSALVPEEELVQFLVDNIIVKGKKE